MSEIKIYTTPTCHWCHETKEFFKAKKIKYKELDITKNEKFRDEMIKKSGQSGVPVMDIDGKIIIGFDKEEILKLIGKSKKSTKKVTKK